MRMSRNFLQKWARMGLFTLVLFTAGQVNALKYVRQVGWDVKIVLYSAAASIKTVLEPVGLKAATGIYAPAWFKDPKDPRWASDAGIKAYRETIAEHGAGVDPDSAITANGYGAAQAVVQVLEAIGDDEITGDSINKSWMTLQGAKSDVLMPGGVLEAGQSGRLVHSYQLMQFDGSTWTDVEPIVDVREVGIAD